MKLFKTSLLTFFFTASLLGSKALANIYKSVDEHGNVTYSDSVDPNAADHEKMDIPNNVNTIETGKSQQQFEQEFMRQAEEDKASLHQSWQNYDKNLKAAKTELDKAAMELEDAKVFKDGDRAYTKTASGGFSRETQQYKDRVKLAESVYDEASRRLAEVKRTKPNQRRPDMTPSAFERSSTTPNTTNAPE